MIQKRANDRRVLDDGPPGGGSERRRITEKPGMEVLESSFEEFELLMTALGYRQTEAKDSKR